jgi:N4-gp56 family major capsid protein
MAGHTYESQASRLAALSGEFIGHAIPTEVLGNCGKQIEMPKNKTDTIIVASWVPYGGTTSAPNTWTVSAQAHITTEGVTPKADTITRRDVSIQLNQYMALYAFTDKDYDLYEDDIVAGMKEQVGERMGLVREMAIYGQMKASTNKFYAGPSGVTTTRATVAGKISGDFLNKMIRSLKANHGRPITKILATSGNYGTTGVEAAFVCYAHTDAEKDIRDLPGFKEVASYGQRKPISDYELGTWQNIRFIISPELYSYQNAATSITASTYDLYSTGGTNPDVYPIILMAQDAFAQVKLRGANAIVPIFLDTKPSKADPGGQRGYVGAKFWHGCNIINNGWLAVGECGVSDLTA